MRPRSEINREYFFSDNSGNSFYGMGQVEAFIRSINIGLYCLMWEDSEMFFVRFSRCLGSNVLRGNVNHFKIFHENLGKITQKIKFRFKRDNKFKTFLLRLPSFPGNFL